MMILVTGATGYVGSAAVEIARKCGHSMTAVARSPDQLAEFEANGMSAVIAELHDWEALRQIASEHDAVLHCAAAASPDFMVTAHKAALAMLEGLPKGGRLVSQRGTLALPASVDRMFELDAAQSLHRAMQAQADLDDELMAAAGPAKTVGFIHAALVFGGEGAAIPGVMQAAAAQAGAFIYPPSGAAQWSLAHVTDYASLLVTFLEKTAAPSQRLTAAGEAVTIASLAKLLASRNGMEARTAINEELELFAMFAPALGIDQSFNRDAARQALGWSPKRSTIAGLEREYAA